MRTIISGPVTDDTLATAEMFGIEPTSYVTDGHSTPPFSTLSTTVYPRCKKLPGDTGKLARDYTLVQNADALVLAGEDDHLLAVAHTYGLAVYQED